VTAIPALLLRGAQFRWALTTLLLAAVSAAAAAPVGPTGALKRHLPNGLRVIVQDNEHTATVVICGFVQVTALHEARVAPGIRQLTQMMVARGDCCDQDLRGAAARVDISVAPDYVELVLAAPAESVGECATLMRRMLFRPELSEQALGAARDSLIRSLAARDETPTGAALERFYSLAYPGVGAGDYGSADAVAVAGITLGEIRRFHTSHYLPNATVVTVSGGVDGTRALDAVSSAMSGLLPGALPDEAPEPAPVQRPGEVELPGVGPTSVYVAGGRAVSLESPQYPAMAVGMTLLGSGMDSRLYRALRIERPLAYTIAQHYTPSRRVPSAFVLATCDRQRLDEVARAIDAEIERAKSEPADAQELARAKRYLIGRQALRRQRNREIAHYLGMFELLGGPQGYRRDAQLAGEVASVDAQDVMGAMARLFDRTWAVRLSGRQTQ